MRKIIFSRAGAGALGVLRWGKGSPAGRKRAVFGSLLAVPVVVLGLAVAPLAMASTAPSLTTNGSDVNIAAEGASGSLDFYWAVNGTATWHPEQVAAAGTTTSAPSLTVDGTDVNIAAAGASGSLDFYWAVTGTTTWHPEQVAPAGTVG